MCARTIELADVTTDVRGNSKLTISKRVGVLRRVPADGVLPLLITVIAGFVCYGVLVNRGMGLPVLGYNISPAERVMNGEMPYRDFIYNYTPGVLWLNALLMRAFGSSVAVINLGLFVFKLSTLVVLFWASRMLSSARAALIPVALVLGWVGYKVVFRAFPTQYSMLFVLLGLILMLRYDRSGRVRWLLLCGVAAGIVFLFKQNVGVLVLVSATFAISAREVLSPEGKPVLVRMANAANGALLCWAGAVAIVTPALLYLAHHGVLGAMLRHFGSLAGEYGARKGIALPPLRLVGLAAIALLAVVFGGLTLLRKRPKLFEPFVAAAVLTGVLLLLVPGPASAAKAGATALMSYVGPALFLLATASVAFEIKTRSREQWWPSFGPTVIVAAFAFGAYMEMYPRADYAHLVRVLPPVFILLFLLASRVVRPLSSYLEGRVQYARRVAIVCAAAPLVLLFCAGLKDTWQPRFDARLHFLEQTPVRPDRARGMLVSRKQAAFIDELTATIEAHSSADDPILSFAPRGTAFYFLSQRRNPSRFLWWRSVGIKRQEREALINSVAEAVPKLVIISQSFSNERVLSAINSRYRLAGEVADLLVYDRETNAR